jgi:hypothetical protein
MLICDCHCHFFSSGFFRVLGAEARVQGDAAVELPARLGWDPPGTDADLGDRWVAELDRRGVARAMVIASTPGDEASVGAAVERHPGRLIGAFMFNPGARGAAARLETAFDSLGLKMACLFPAMHGVDLDAAGVAAVFASAARHGRAVFIHCGALSIGVRKKLGLPSRFDFRLGNPLAVAVVAAKYPHVPVVIPHFGAGFFREALMAALAAPNIILDTSSSNDWIKLYPGLRLGDVFARALDCLGPTRLMFGTDSSFFPRGWQQPVFDRQRAVLDDLGVDAAAQALVFGGNFNRVYGV